MIARAKTANIIHWSEAAVLVLNVEIFVSFLVSYYERGSNLQLDFYSKNKDNILKKAFRTTAMQIKKCVSVKSSQQVTSNCFRHLSRRDD